MITAIALASIGIVFLALVVLAIVWHRNNMLQSNLDMLHIQDLRRERDEAWENWRRSR